VPNADYVRSRKQAPDVDRTLLHVTDPAFGGGRHRPVSDPGSEAWRRTSTERPGHQRARIRTIGETCNQPRKSTVNQFLWPVGRSVAYCKVDEMDLDFPPAMKRESRYGMLVASARPDRSVPGVVGQ
jgi:hypothetical protein